MTVSVLRNKAQYTGNGSSTQFEITFAYTETSQIKVYLDGSLQTLTTHYTITDPGQTGTVTFVTAPDSGVVISLIRETDYLQTVDYANNDILDAETLESAFDKLTMMCQQLKSLIDGSVGFDETVSDAETTSLKLAAGITDLAGKLLAFDATGNFVTTQEIGTWQGDYSASTAYVVRDIVKDPSTDNVYFTKRNAPAGTSLSNTTYFALLVDVETVRTLKEAAELAENNAETAQAAAEAALASFQGQYKVGATNPYSGTPDAGDLWYDTTNSILKYYVSGTGFEPVTTSLATVTDNYLTISNQVITAGTVPISLGGTGATTASGARTALGLAIGTDVQAYDADTAKYDDTTANFTGTLQNGGSNVVVDSDIGSTVQAYDADTAKYDAVTANFTGTLQNGGSNVVVDSDIGSTVQAYDADLSAIAGLSNADGNFIVGSATGWTVESGATARTSLGLGTLATQSTITESQISDLQSYITASSTDTLTNKSGAISQWTNDSGYLTAETNDLTASVTWANVPDANITQSSVTQHQAALSITESQISDLQSYLTAETNDLGSAVTGTLPIANGGTSATTASAARIALLPTLGTAGQVLAVNTGATDVEWVNAAAGVGLGTVTSVAISGTDGIEVDSGSPITTSGTIALGINASTLSSHLSLGTAATTASTDYATAAQGALADSAVQPGDNANTLGSGAATDGYVLTAVGDGTTAWEAVSGGGGSGDKIEEGNSSVEVVDTGTGYVVVTTEGAEAVRIDGSGRLLVGTSTARDLSSGVLPLAQIESQSTSVFSVTRNGADNFGPYISLVKSRGTATGSNSLVSDDDEIGSISFYGTDGSNAEPGALIQGYVDGTPGANDMPGRLVFSTTGDGFSIPTERMRINSSGNVGIAVTNPTQKLDVDGNINASGSLTLGTALAVAEGGTGVTSLGSLDAADLGSGAATDGYVLTADGAGNAAWEAASGGGGGITDGDKGDITVSSSGTVWTIDNSVVTNAKLSLSANDSNIKTALNAGGSAPIYACRAWVNFNGTGTVAIRESGNVSSITDDGTGRYIVNFTTDMSDSNYSITGLAGISGSSSVAELRSAADVTTSSFAIYTRQLSTGNLIDCDIVCASVFR